MQNKSFKSITTRKRSNIDIISKQVLLNKNSIMKDEIALWGLISSTSTSQCRRVLNIHNSYSLNSAPWDSVPNIPIST